MFGGVQVHALQSIGMMPSMGAVLGTGHSTAVLQRLRDLSGGSVIFGQEGDPYAERYNFLRHMVDQQLELADRRVSETRKIVLNAEYYYPIVSIDDMYEVGPAMQEVIVNYAPIRQLLEDGRISGYGINPDNLPEEDVYGRLLNNGRVDKDSKQVVWEFASTDPKLTEVDLEAIEQTRGWIDRWLVEQMEPGGKWKDPTDPANTISKKMKKH